MAAPFRDRGDAGRRLGEALRPLAGENPLVLAIPRGGVEVGLEAARLLDAPFSLILARKLPLPADPEAGFGAIAEKESIFIQEGMLPHLSREVVERSIAAQEEELAERREKLRGGRPLPEMEGATVILVDDGIAMGSTMRAAIETARKCGAAKIIAAAPVASPGVTNRLSRLADQAVVLVQPRHFRAVAQAYGTWYDVPDGEVLALLEEAARQGRLAAGPSAKRRRE